MIRSPATALARMGWIMASALIGERNSGWRQAQLHAVGVIFSEAGKFARGKVEMQVAGEIVEALLDCETVAWRIPRLRFGELPPTRGRELGSAGNRYRSSPRPGERPTWRRRTAVQPSDSRHRPDPRSRQKRFGGCMARSPMTSTASVGDSSQGLSIGSGQSWGRMPHFSASNTCTRAALVREPSSSECADFAHWRG